VNFDYAVASRVNSYELEVGSLVSPVFGRLALVSSLFSWLRCPFTASGPKRDMCLVVI